MFRAVNTEAKFWSAARPVSQLSGLMASWKIVSTPRAFNADFRYGARINTEACVLDECTYGCINSVSQVEDVVSCLCPPNSKKKTRSN